MLILGNKIDLGSSLYHFITGVQEKVSRCIFSISVTLGAGYLMESGQRKVLGSFFLGFGE